MPMKIVFDKHLNNRQFFRMIFAFQQFQFQRMFHFDIKSESIIFIIKILFILIALLLPMLPRDSALKKSMK